MAQLPFTFQGRVRRPADAEARDAGPEPGRGPRADAARDTATPEEAPKGPPILTVSQLQSRTRRALEHHFSDVWVAGEISNFDRHHRSGHAYFSLKDRGATLRAVMFRDDLARLRFPPRDGLEVLARGRVTVYPKSGSMQLGVVHLEPRGAGALQAEFEARRRALEAEGLTDPARRRPVPLHPRVVGLVTSRGSAAMQDVLRTLLRRDPRVHVRCAFSQVQGKSAAFHVVRALARLEAAGCDVVIVARGGGSAEDLWAFNEAPVVRAIAAFGVPVITGIGHESDTTLADLVADLRTSTPTAAAEHAVPVRAEVLDALRVMTTRLQRGLQHHLHLGHRRLQRLEARLPAPSALVPPHAQALDDLSRRADRAAARRVSAAQSRWRELERRLRDHSPAARVAQTTRRLDAARLRLEHAAGHTLARPRTRLEGLEARLGRAFGPPDVARRRARLRDLERRLDEAARRRVARLDAELRARVQRLDALSPLAVLGRGYALVRDAEGRVVKAAAEAPVGAPLTVQLKAGRLDVRVEANHEDPDA